MPRSNGSVPVVTIHHCGRTLTAPQLSVGTDPNTARMGTAQTDQAVRIQQMHQLLSNVPDATSVLHTLIQQAVGTIRPDQAP
jgi:hypothetical protein